MKFKFLLAAGSASATAAMLASAPAMAQSTGSVDFEGNTVVVTGEFVRNVGGLEVPNTPKAKQELSQEIIRRQRPGQTVNDIINLVPGVSFQNNDPWGSGGGGFTIRGFGSDRVSQTIDGVPLNDSGNYAMYTNQQVDPEVLESVNVNLGTTDVDSPTASATGGTVNLRTRRPADEFKITATASYGNVFANGSNGDRPYYRIFGMMDTGEITAAGTTAFFSGSYTEYENPFNNYGKVRKQQYNGRIYQPLSDNGDFVSIAGHYNQNRNNFFGSQEYDAMDLAGDDFPDTRKSRFYDINYPCTIPTANAGDEDYYSDSSSSGDCGSEFDRRYNPSNTGNVRINSRITLSDKLVLTVDPSYQYVKANGGGPEGLYESFKTFNGVDYTGVFGGRYYYGMDLNGDGDTLDVVAGNDPSQTITNRFGVIASLNYEINDEHRVRLAYTWDRARHRQTGQTSLMLQDGEPMDVFPINNPLISSDGTEINKRNRLSWAILHQVSGEYRGEFGPLTANIGLRAPFFSRNLNQYCYTTSISGYVDCFAGDATAYEAANPNAVAPVSVSYKYDKLLPNVGFTLDVMDKTSIFANYSKGLSVPGTDPLYNSIYLFNTPGTTDPAPETTDSFDLGLRYQSGSIQAQVSGWYTKFSNRLASAYDPDANEGNGATVYRNLGTVDKWGLDASVAWRPTRNTLLYVFGSWYDSEIKEDVIGGTCSADDVAKSVYSCSAEGITKYLPTGGKQESGSPTWSVGARGQVSIGDFDLGAQVKHTGERWLNDANTHKVDGYTLVDLDLRYTIREDIAIQLNVTNLFDELYVGYFGSSFDDTSPNAQIGAPRAASISLIYGY